jgi:hypothetical protein
MGHRVVQRRHRLYDRGRAPHVRRLRRAVIGYKHELHAHSFDWLAIGAAGRSTWAVVCASSGDACLAGASISKFDSGPKHPPAFAFAEHRTASGVGQRSFRTPMPKAQHQSRKLQASRDRQRSLFQARTTRDGSLRRCRDACMRRLGPDPAEDGLLRSKQNRKGSRRGHRSARARQSRQGRGHRSSCSPACPQTRVRFFSPLRLAPSAALFDPPATQAAAPRPAPYKNHRTVLGNRPLHRARASLACAFDEAGEGEQWRP